MAIHALNSLYFGGNLAEKSEVDNTMSLPLCQRECIKSLVQCIAAFGSPPAGASRRGALSALRASSSGYEEPLAGVGEVCNMELERLSLPSGQVAGVDLQSSLEGPLQEMLCSYEDWLLQDASTWSALSEEAYRIKPYSDPCLSDRAKYIDFLSHLHHCGILGVSSQCRGRVGAFCVTKKPKMTDGVLVQRQRLILDCRQVNLQFKPPPHCELGALSALTEIVLGKDDTLYVSGADIQDCFYAARLPPGLADFFCLPHDISLDEYYRIFGDDASFEYGRSWVSPCITVLPMGFSWSFYLIQKLHEQSAIQALNCSRDRLFLDGYPAPKLSGEYAAAMPYCDNIHSLALSAEACQKAKDDMTGVLKSMGFSIHEDEEATYYFQTLGGVVDGKNGIVKVTPTRAWNIILAFETLLEDKVDWEVLRRLLGHSMTICTINRCGMSVFRALYDFVEDAPPPRRLNQRERQEVLNFIGIVPLLVGYMKRDWSTTVSCSDASPQGYGVCQRELEPPLVESLGAWQDRWRFRHLDPSQWRPRERFAGLDPVSDVRTARSCGVAENIEDFYSYNNYFPEVPEHVLDADQWSTKLMGKWGHTGDHITVKEGHSLVLAVRRLCRSGSSRGKRHLIFIDSFSLSMAVCKGRATSFKLLRITQQLAALSLAGGITVRVRWVPSEHNVADGPSRGQVSPGAFCPGHGSQGASAEDKTECSFDQAEGKGLPPNPLTVCTFSCHGESDQEEVEPSCPKQGIQETLHTEDPFQKGGSVRGSMWVGESQPSHASRAEISLEGGGEPVRRLLPEVCEFLQGAWSSGTTKRTHRRAPGGVHGPHFLAGKRFERRGKGLGQRRVPASLSQGRIEQKPKSFERMAEGAPSRQQSPIATSDRLWHEHGHGSEKSARNGAQADSRLRHLHATWREPRSQRFKLSPSSEGCRSTISLASDCRSAFRRRPSRQSWRVRQQFGSQQPRKSMAGRSPSSPCQDPSEQRQTNLFLHLDEFRKEFQQVGEALGLKNLHPYQLRHGGAAEDLNSKERDHQAVKARGRWHADASVRRYTKVSRLQQLMGRLLPGKLEYCRWSQKNLEKVFRGQLAARKP